jgi:hypothetical protein
MAILSIEEFLSSNPKDVPMPDWTRFGVVSLTNKIIPFDMIFIDDEIQQKTKEETHTPQEIQFLKLSFASGVDTNEFPGGVFFRGTQQEKPILQKYLDGQLSDLEFQLALGVSKPFGMIYAFGRTESQIELKQDRWMFTVLAGTADQLEDVQAAENEALPKRINKEIDMRKYLKRKVNDGRIENSQDSIVEAFKKIYSTRDASTRGRVVSAVMEECNTPQPIRIYPSTARAQQWIDNHSSEEYFIGGKEDVVRGQFGVVIKEGYLYRVLAQAARRFRKTGKYTYVLAHIGAATKDKTIHEKRAKMVNEWLELKEDFAACGMKDFPLSIEGFLPQIRDVEDMKKLVPIDNYLDKRKAA